MFSTWTDAFSSKEGRCEPTSRLIVPTALGTRESLDGTTTGSEGEKQTVDVGVGTGDTVKLLSGCSCISSLTEEFETCVSNSGPTPAGILETCVALELPGAIWIEELEGARLQKYPR